MNEVRIFDTEFTVKRVNGKSDLTKYNVQDTFYEEYLDMLKFLSSIGFNITHDKEYGKIFNATENINCMGQYGDLKMKATYHTWDFSVVFYQDIVFYNKNGGLYDFYKLKTMPYLIQKQFQLTEKKLIEYFLGKGYQVTPRPKKFIGEDYIINEYVTSCHEPQEEWFDLRSIDGETTKFNYNNKDRNGKVIYNGDIKYFRHRESGYLYRGRVYHGINNVWYVLLTDNTVEHIACFDLFDLQDSDFRGRQKLHKPPREYIARKEQLQNCSIKELENELKKRRKKASNQKSTKNLIINVEELAATSAIHNNKKGIVVT